jgi:hypothetical protein
MQMHLILASAVITKEDKLPDQIIDSIQVSYFTDQTAIRFKRLYQQYV